MRRRIQLRFASFFALVLLCVACGDPTAPRAAQAANASGECWAYSREFTAAGVAYTVWVHYDECPTDNALAADGFTRGERD